MATTRWKGPIILQTIAAGGTAPDVEPGVAITGASVGILAGSGLPTVQAPKGSLYLRTDGSSGTTRAYINTDGATTWTSITTAL